MIEAHNTAKPDIWKNHAVTLAADEKLTPVVIGIWDSGVDPAVYPNQLFINPDFKPTTPPGNLDPHGLAFDLHSNPVHGELYPLGDNAKRVTELKSQIKGMLDLNAAVDSPEGQGAAHQDVHPPAGSGKAVPRGPRSFRQLHPRHPRRRIASDGNPFARLLIAASRSITISSRETDTSRQAGRMSPPTRPPSIISSSTASAS